MGSVRLGLSPSLDRKTVGMKAGTYFSLHPLRADGVMRSVRPSSRRHNVFSPFTTRYVVECRFNYIAKWANHLTASVSERQWLKIQSSTIPINSDTRHIYREESFPIRANTYIPPRVTLVRWPPRAIFMWRHKRFRWLKKCALVVRSRDLARGTAGIVKLLGLGLTRNKTGGMKGRVLIADVRRTGSRDCCLEQSPSSGGNRKAGDVSDGSRLFN